MVTIILFAPLIGAIIAGFGHRIIGDKGAQVLTTGLLFLAALLSWIVFLTHDPANTEHVQILRWVESGTLSTDWSIRLDRLTSIMLIVVTTVSSLVHLYSMGYMAHDPQFEGESYRPRFFAYLSFFTFAMLMLVTSDNLLQMFFGWEGVGVASYLLIGFYYRKPSANAAAIKAFVVNRVGDFGFALGIFGLFFLTDSIRFDEVFAAAPGLAETSITFLWRDWNAANLIAFLLFVGAMGKSAQLFLHTWLPDAMEGPTPVSALIHAATMVAAGVFLVARFFPVFEASGTMMNVIILIGGFTALFAATMGLVATDIKRVLAYSTVSQLGYMMLALGVGAYSVAIFHLFTHAFFKALLFLGSGSVNHASGTFDMRYMGGLRKVMPITYASFVIGGISLAGILPFAGGWSKDEVLTAAWNGAGAIPAIGFWMALLAAGMTGFYIFRAIILTFHGDFRKGADAEGIEDTHGAGVHLKESPIAMVFPLILLSIAAVGIGFVVNPLFDLGIVPQHWFGHFLGQGPVHVEIEDFNVVLAPIAMLVSISGIVLAFLMYQTKVVSAEQLGARFKPVYTLLVRKYYFDELYEDIIVRRFFYGGVARTLDWIDGSIINNIGKFIGWLGANVGTALRQLQTGQTQEYGAAISIGILTIVGLYLWFL